MFKELFENVTQKDLNKDAISSISRLTGTRTQAIEKFAEENNIDLTKMYKAVATKKIKPMDLATAIIGFDKKATEEVIKKIEKVKDV
jgi:hypothetical protein